MVGVTIFIKDGTREALTALIKKYNLRPTAAVIRGRLHGVTVSPLTTTEIIAIRCDRDVEFVSILYGP
jgi:hypothetical protein